MSRELLAKMSSEARALQTDVDNEWEPYGCNSASAPNQPASASAPKDVSTHSEARPHDTSDEPDAAVLSILGNDALSTRIMDSLQQYSVVPWLLDTSTSAGVDRLLDEQSWSSLKEIFKAGTSTGEMMG